MGIHRVIALLACVWMTSALAEPRVPDRDDEVLERVLPTGNPVARELETLKQQLQGAPRDAALAARYARRAIEQGRASGDPRYYGYAEAALNLWRDDPMPPLDLQVLRATLLQQRHEFAAAVAELDRVLARDPGQAQARLTRAVVLQVQGRPRDAEADCVALSGRASPAIVSICLASAISLSGRTQEALQILSRTLADVADTGILLWGQTLRAEIYMRRDEREAAERAFQDALRTMRSNGITDFYLLAAYGDYLLDSGRAADLLSLFSSYPLTDALLLRQALAAQTLAKTGGRDMAERARIYREQLRERIADSRARGDDSHAREQAWFELHLNAAPTAALSLAADNWRNQREPLDARLLLEAALAAGHSAAARPVLDWMADTGIEDVHLRELRARVIAAP